MQNEPRREFLYEITGVGELDVRVTLQTDDGAPVYVTYRGYLSRVMELAAR